MPLITDVDAPPIRQMRRPPTAPIEPKPARLSAWHTFEVADVLHRLGTHPTRGLDDATVAQRQTASGPNELVAQGVKSPWRILRDQLTATMVVVLIVAAVASALLGDYSDTAAILAIIVLNAILGFSQEYRAERAMTALQKLTVPTVTVRRNGRIREMEA